MVKFYTSHCPMCRQIKGILDKSNIEYEEIADETEYLAIAELNSIKSMPFAEIDGVILNTQKLMQWAIAKSKEKKYDYN